MRISLIIIPLFVSSLCFAQVKTTVQTDLVDSGKHEFRQQAQSQTPDYSAAFRMLSNEVKQNPTNAELRYFLGYTIDRLNANDGDGMYKLKREMTIKASEQFEEVIRLTPIYKGELIILDPYAKLTSMWGSLAQSYLTRKLVDSAKWSFLEGRKRGGFMEPLLHFNRQLLNSCDKNAILITYGDNITIPIWYLQTIENYRNDITVVDANLLNTAWYSKYLKAETNLKISFNDAQIDTIGYISWKPQIVEAVHPDEPTRKFSWELQPTYMEGYISKGDRILLNIVQQNFFSRPFFFSNNSDTTYNLFLSPYLLNEGVVDRVVNKALNYKEDLVAPSRNLYTYNIINIKKEEIAKSQDAIIILNNFRWAFYNNVYRLVTRGNYDKARELIKQMTGKFTKDKLPFTSEEEEKYFAALFGQVDKNYH